MLIKFNATLPLMEHGKIKRKYFKSITRLLEQTYLKVSLKIAAINFYLVNPRIQQTHI